MQLPRSLGKSGTESASPGPPARVPALGTARRRHAARTRLCMQIGCALALVPPPVLAGSGVVSNCNDSGDGSLRSAIATAASPATITFDSGAMNCSTITLTTGQLQVDVAELTLQGPNDATITIHGNDQSRVINDRAASGPPDTVRKLTIERLTIAHGRYVATLSYAEGGCIAADGDVTLRDSTVTACQAIHHAPAGMAVARGGGLSVNTLHLYRSVLSGNTALSTNDSTCDVGAYGGGASVQSGLVVESSTVNGNAALASSPCIAIPPPPCANASQGGGLALLHASEPVGIVASTFSDNDAGFGGGLSMNAFAPVAIDRSTFSGNNTCDRYAGLAVFAGQYAVTVVNSTVSGNDSIGGGAGAGLGGDPVSLINDTIAYNVAGSDANGGMAAGLNTTAPRLYNTLIASNTVTGGGASDLDTNATAAIGSNNLVTSVLPGTVVPADTLSGVDPKLLPLSDYGGPAATHALAIGSPAIDRGSACLDAYPATDQRGAGFPRVRGERPDIGAYEFDASEVIFRSSFDGETCAPPAAFANSPAPLLRHDR